MHHFLSLLTHASSKTEVIVFSITLFLCWNLESIAGLTMLYKKWDHAFLNSKFILTNLPIQILLGFVFTKTIQWTSLHHFGIIYHLPFRKNNFLQFLFAFLFLDFGEYVY